MVRDWDLIRDILQAIEENDLPDYMREEKYKNLPRQMSKDDFFGHMEILIEAGIIKNCEVKRNTSGKFSYWNFVGAYISLEGHDLLDALRDETLWKKIKEKAKSSGLLLSWEVVKASIPIVIKELLIKS